MLRDILEPRTAELMELTVHELERGRFEQHLSAGLVLVGGGAKLSGLLAAAERELKMPVRLGQPSGIEELGDLLDPAFAATVGLALYGNRRQALDSSQKPGWTDRLKAMFGGDGDE
jgi:cell division protein FtsA